jgi:outer membrane immunogenic protein
MNKISTLLCAAAAVAAISAPAAAADMRMPVKAPPPVAAVVFSWTGFYIGANAGGVWSEADFGYAANPAGFGVVGAAAINVAGTNSYDQSGFTAGGQIGYNWQTGIWVWGLEGDVQYTDVKGGGVIPVLGAPIGTVVTQDYKSEWLATIRGRLGVAFDRVLIYGTAGVAFAEVKWADSVIFPATGTFNAAASSDTRVGWVAGGGIEWAFAPNWSLKGEALYVDLGEVGYTSLNSAPLVFPTATIAHDHKLTEIIARAGINYRF